MNSKHQQYLAAMGIEVWQRRGTACHISTDEACDSSDSVVQSQLEPDWETLEKSVALCQQCALHKSRTQTVFGVGSHSAEVMLIGEAPGANEDLQGKPFVGRAGMLLNAMLHAIGLEREEVYIANILKCRPPNNRDPQPDEVALCTPFLQQQIALIQPKVIIAVGRIAAQFLLNTAESMARLRGRQYVYGALKTPLFVIYHPAYLLRSPREKSKAYIDMLQIQRYLRK